MIQTVVLIVHVFAAAALIGLVLLQRGKGAEAGAAFGAGASGTVFGARGSSSFLSRTTAVLATIFFATSLTLAYLATQKQAPTSLMENLTPGSEQVEEMPAVIPSGVEESGVPALPTTEEEEAGEAGDGS